MPRAVTVDRAAFSKAESLLLLVADSYTSDDTGQQADEQIVVADPDPLLASVRTMQTMAVIVTDGLMAPPFRILLARFQYGLPTAFRLMMTVFFSTYGPCFRLSNGPCLR